MKSFTSVGHHDFLDGSVLGLWGRVGGSGEETRPPDGEQAQAASHCCKPQHPDRDRKKEENTNKGQVKTWGRR